MKVDDVNIIRELIDFVKTTNLEMFFFFVCVSNVFFIRIFVSVHIVVLLILFTILNYMVTWSHIVLRTNY